MKPFTSAVLAATTLFFVGCAEKAPKGGTMMTSQALDHQKQKDMQVIEALASHGSDLSKPHMIEHHFITHTRENGTRLLEWGSKNAFQTSKLEEGQWEGKQYFYFDLIKPTIPTIENVFPDTCQMLRLAEEYGCDYDGWGCNVAK